MKFANAIKIHRKSGVRFGERGAPVPLVYGFCKDRKRASGAKEFA